MFIRTHFHKLGIHAKGDIGNQFLTAAGTWDGIIDGEDGFHGFQSVFLIHRYIEH